MLRWLHLFNVTCAYAGSKIRVTSMINMALELVAVLLGYKVFRQWSIKTEAEV